MLSQAAIRGHLEACERYLALGNYSVASILMNAVLKLFFGSGSGAGQFSSTSIRRMAKILRELGDIEDDGRERYLKAQDVLLKAIERYPEDEGLVNEVAELYSHQGHYDKTIDILKRFTSGEATLPLQTERVRACATTSKALRKLLRFDEVEETLNRTDLGEAQPTPQILLERGWLAFDLEEYANAFERFAEVLDRADADADQKQMARAGQIASLQAEHIAESKDGGDQSDKAGDLMKKWLAGAAPEISKDNAMEVLRLCGEKHYEQNNYRAALLAYELVLELDTPDPSQVYSPSLKAYELKMEALKWLRCFDKVEKVFAEAWALFPNSVDLWNEMGHTIYRQKRHQDALDYFTGDRLDQITFAGPMEKEAFAFHLNESEYAIEWTIVLLRKMHCLAASERRVDEALSRFKNNVNFLSERAVIHFSKRAYEKAIAVFDRVLQLDEYNEFALQWRAASYRKLRKFTEAKKQIDDALLKLPGSSELWEEMAWLAFDQNQLKEADEHFAKSIQRDPYLIHKQFSRVEVLTRLSHSDDALKILLGLKERYPGDIEVAEQLGWFYLRRGEVDHADEQFDFIEKTDPENALGINGRGGYHLEQRDYESAEASFRWALDLVDYEPQYYLNLAWSLIRQVKEPGEIPESEISSRRQLLDSAKECCRAALEFDQFNAKAHVCLGVIAFKCGDFPDAKGHFLKSLDLSPVEGGRLELGALYVQMGRYDEAEKELTEAIQINRNDARPYIELGNLRLLQEKNKEAVRECRTGVAVEPNNDEAHRAFAIALMRAGQYEEAEKALRKAILQIGSPKHWRLNLALSQILIHLGDDENKGEKKKDTGLYGEALNHVHKALRAHPAPNADVSFHAAIAHFKLEDYKSSRKSFAECLKADRERFEAERYGKMVQAMIDHEKKVLRVNSHAATGLAIFCAGMLLLLWVAYLSGWARTVPVAETEVPTVANANSTAAQKPETAAATARVNEVVKAAEAAKVAETSAAEAAKAKDTEATEANKADAAAKAAKPPNQATLAKVAEQAKAEAAKAAEASRVAEAARVTAVGKAEDAVKAATKPPKPQQEVLVDKNMLTVYTPMFIGLFVIALLLPNLSKLKLFGSIEAEITAAQPDISSGPKGDVGFGSSLPLISPGPGGR